MYTQTVLSSETRASTLYLQNRQFKDYLRPIVNIVIMRYGWYVTAIRVFKNYKSNFHEIWHRC